jgi:hypothetical protein
MHRTQVRDEARLVGATAQDCHRLAGAIDWAISAVAARIADQCRVFLRMRHMQLDICTDVLFMFFHASHYG